jgi:hypothetical protein
MIRIKFSDTDWLDADGKILKMSLEDDFLTNGRLTHHYTAPVITEENWGGETFPVQINIWESYIIEFYVKELAVNMMNKMIVCKNIMIEDFQSGELITVDTQSTGGITLEAGDRLGTSGQRFNIICKSRKIKIYPGISVDLTNTLRIVDNIGTYNFYTDQKIIKFITEPTRGEYQKSDGLQQTSMTLSKDGCKMVFYLMENNAITLKRKIENIGYTSIKINPNTDNLTVNEVGKCTLTQLSEGLYRCEVEFIINPNLMFA